jgi:hypothetical protein
MNVNEDQLALMCVDEISMPKGREDPFGQSAYGELRGYFEKLRLSEEFEFVTGTDEQVISHFRRFVFTKAKDRLYELLQQADAGLSRILRSIKELEKKGGGFVIVERFGTDYIVPSFCDPLEHLDSMPSDELAYHFFAEAKKKERTPEFMKTVLKILSDQAEYRRRVSLDIVLAIFRRVHGDERDFLIDPSRLYCEESNTEIAIPSRRPSIVEEVPRVVENACCKVKKERQNFYVGNRGVTMAMYDSYFEALKRYVCAKLMNGGKAKFSLYESLSSVVPDLSMEEYRASHKNQLEYLQRLTYGLAVKRLKQME